MLLLILLCCLIWLFVVFLLSWESVFTVSNHFVGEFVSLYLLIVKGRPCLKIYTL